MFEIKNRKAWIALLGLLLLFAACKGETPTAPPAGSQNPPGGGSTPVTGANLVLTASNTNPIIDTTVTITATVTQNGQPVPNGTAVEFTTTAGTFTDVTPPVTALIRTTTNGVATVHLTASAVGIARVTATVNNVTRSIDITFRTTPICTPPDPRCPPSTAPTITSVTPNVGKPQGGDTIRISGTNFIAPLRVLFDVGTGTPIEGVITNSGPTFIDVLTPSVNLGAGQQLVANVIVITKVGTGNEERVVSNGAFTFRNVSLTPIIHSLSPTSGPINGGTRVTIFGEGFQAPVQVFFGSAEAQVVSTDFGQIIVVAPDGRSTSPDGSLPVTGAVAVRVVNINSNTRGDSPEQFRYVAKMQITAISPLVGPAVGGTDVTIDGIGFDAPVQVLIETDAGTVEAQVIRVSGTQVLIRTPPLPNGCVGGSGRIRVTNIENGDFALSSSNFTFIGVAPQITSATNPVTAGTTLNAIVANPGVGPLGTASIRFDLGRGTTPSTTFTIIPSPATINTSTGNQPFSIAVPLTGFTFPSVSCNVGGPTGPPGTQPGPVDVPLTFRNVTTGCSDTVTVTVLPANPVCTQAPAAASVTAPATGCAIATATVGSTGSTSITIRNTAASGAQNLTVTGAVSPGTSFSINPNTQVSIAPGASTSFNVTFTAAAAPGSTAGTATFTTNDPNNPTLSVCLTGNTTAPAP